MGQKEGNQAYKKELKEKQEWKTRIQQGRKGYRKTENEGMRENAGI